MWSANQTKNFRTSLHHVVATSEADLPEIYQSLISGLTESHPSVRSCVREVNKPRRLSCSSFSAVAPNLLCSAQTPSLGQFLLAVHRGSRHKSLSWDIKTKSLTWSARWKNACEQETARWRQRSSFVIFTSQDRELVSICILVFMKYLIFPAI